MDMGPSPGPEGRAVWQYHYQQGPYAQPGYAAPPYQYQSPYTHMSYGYPGAPPYPTGGYAYSPPMEMAPLHPAGKRTDTASRSGAVVVRAEADTASAVCLPVCLQQVWARGA